MANDDWDITHLHEHLQYAVQLEYWTIPYYMAAMYSIEDPTTEAYKLVQSVVYQEMLHVELAANVANAFGAPIDLEHVFISPPYTGETIPHLLFRQGQIGRDPEDPTQSYSPWSAEIGPLDETRINTMCLIEYPEFDVPDDLDLHQNVQNYQTIGEFYQALLIGAAQYVDMIQGDHDQVDIFGNFYKNLASSTVTEAGAAGLAQVTTLIHVITDQGEGVRRSPEVPIEFRNTADGFNNSDDHFTKFNVIKDLQDRPATYDAVAVPPAGSEGAAAQAILLENFNRFRNDMVTLFTGGAPENFGPNMAVLGGNILNCWRHGALPNFTEQAG